MRIIRNIAFPVNCCTIKGTQCYNYACNETKNAFRTGPALKAKPNSEVLLWPICQLMLFTIQWHWQCVDLPLLIVISEKPSLSGWSVSQILGDTSTETYPSINSSQWKYFIFNKSYFFKSTNVILKWCNAGTGPQRKQRPHSDQGQYWMHDQTWKLLCELSSSSSNRLRMDWLENVKLPFGLFSHWDKSCQTNQTIENLHLLTKLIVKKFISLK